MPPKGPASEKSAGVIATISALFAIPLSLLKLLIPLTARRPFSEDAFTTIPPGHMQNEYTPRPLVVFAVTL